MMNRWMQRLLFTTAMMSSCLAFADGVRGKPNEAQALVAKAIALYDEAGREAAFAAIEDHDGDLVDRDLYVFVYGPERTIVAHGYDASLKGTPTDSLVDADGVAFGTKLQDEATEDGTWIDYQWYDPVTHAVMPKSSWAVRHDGYVFGVGVYKP